MKRRRFVQQSSIAGSGLVLSPGLFRLRSAGIKHIGVQLYSVREDMYKDAKKTIAAVGKIGYEEVEGFGYNEGKFFGMTPAEFKTVLKDSGLTMPSMHYIVSITSWDNKAHQLSDNVKTAIEVFAGLGQKQIVCPFIVNAQRDQSSIEKLCDIFNKTGELCKQHGMRFAYHNHDFEFISEGGPLIYDMLLRGTSPDLMEMQLDLYWVAYAGQDPMEWIKRLGTRLTSLHVKDMGTDSKSVEVGEGKLDFASMFAMPEASNVKYYIVELEHYKRTPMEGIEVSYHNLKKLLNA